MPSTEWQLGLRTIYILPSRLGVLWLASAALLMLVAIQTGSNSTLLLAFLLLGVMALATVLTHDNLHGVTLRCTAPAPGFAQEPQLYPVLLVCPTPRQQLQLRFEGQPPAGVVCCPAGERRVELRWTPDRRGRQRPPRLWLYSVAPLGLFICWTRWRPAVPQLIWPARRPGPVQTSDPRPLQSGLEEWQDLRPCAAAIVRLWWTGLVQPKVDRCRSSSSAILPSVITCSHRPPACPGTPPSNISLNASGSCITREPVLG